MAFSKLTQTSTKGYDAVCYVAAAKVNDAGFLQDVEAPHTLHVQAFI